MRHAQRCIADFSGLLPEDCAEQPLLCRKFRLTLWRDLAHQDVPAVYFCADANHAAAVEVFQRVLTHIGDVARDLFRPQLSVSGLRFKLLHVNGGEYIVLHQPFRQQYGVLVVVALPRHKSDEQVFSESNLSLFRGGAVSQDISLLYGIAGMHQRQLVDAGALIAAAVFDHIVVVILAVFVSHDNFLSGAALDHAVLFCDDEHAAVVSSLALHARADDRRFGNQQRHSLPLHVGTHQRAVCVVVFQEGDHRRGHRYELLGRNVHQVDLLRSNLHKLISLSACDTTVYKASVLIQRLVCLCHNIGVLHIGGHIFNLLCDNSLLLVDHPVRRFNKAVLVDPRIGGKRADQSDIRAFGRLNGAHSAVV